MRYVYPPKVELYRRWALLVLRSPAGRDVGGCEKLVTIERVRVDKISGRKNK